MNQQTARVTYSSLLLEVLEDPQRIGFKRIITADESSFFVYDVHDSVWGESRHELPDGGTQKSDTEKCRISIIWSVNGIHSLIGVPTGSTNNRECPLTHSEKAPLFAK
jgi:hypothetical protein